MRSPSTRILANTADIYRATIGQDNRGGWTATYAQVPSALAVPCSVQAGSIMEVMDEEQGKITQYIEYWIMFGSIQAVKARDKLIWQDRAGIDHVIFVQSQLDNAGRGSAFTVRGLEKI